ncbi:hypothetical protein [Erysipelothrix piscisicarius]|uniref:hypothetical protein n=1 Tax=Erysipelothrix piscisicarius TaxID=2485784 RepID=UPI002F926B10
MIFITYITTHKEIITRLRDALLDSFGNHDAYIMDLPAAVATHAGLGTVAIQWIPKPINISCEVVCIYIISV